MCFYKYYISTKTFNKIVENIKKTMIWKIHFNDYYCIN